MKIVFVNDSIYAYALGTPVGGAERQQWLLARALAAAGWSVTVGVRKALDAGAHRALDGVECVGIGRGQIFSAWYRLLSSERPDWWYWRCADHLWGPAVEIAKLTAVRTIFAAAFDSDVQPRHALFRRPRWWPLFAWGLARTDRIFVQHSRQFSKLALPWQSKAYIVPSLAGETTIVKPHSERKKSVAWVAMLQQSKRPDLLVEIAQRTPHIRFIVCGGLSSHRSPPGYSERIVDALRALPNIEYRGLVAPDHAQQVIADAAILLSTSDGEGFPNTFLEAWLSGTPVVSLKIDPDCIIERAGLGVVSGSMENTIANINVLMDSPQQREEIAARARQYIAEAHSEAAVITAFECAIRGGRT